jgi:hypothetical protein
MSSQDAVHRESETKNEDVEKDSGHDGRPHDTDELPALENMRSHTATHDMPAVDQYAEAGDEIYDKFPHHRKIVMTAVLSFCGFLAPISSTTILSAVPEVAAEYHTTGSIINLSNGLYLIFMGLSPMFWGPMGQVYGRRWVCALCQVREARILIST